MEKGGGGVRRKGEAGGGGGGGIHDTKIRGTRSGIRYQTDSVLYYSTHNQGS